LVEAYELFKAIEARQREPQVILERQLDGVATPVPYKPVPYKTVELKLHRPRQRL
jgi:hypothetical protein